MHRAPRYIRVCEGANLGWIREVARMSERQDLIKRMLELQQKFREYDREHGVTEQDLYTAAEGSFLHQYQQEFPKLADRLVNVAHDRVGSVRD